ncbi:hypothetical protein Bbelb_418000 [Branchiostoma belcheri]|nr:hypothetical protein Bbelb_418000 [Branchiostoma belcheri]
MALTSWLLAHVLVMVASPIVTLSSVPGAGRWTGHVYRLREITYFKPPTQDRSFAVKTDITENKAAFLLCSRGYFISNLSVRYGSRVQLQSDDTAVRLHDLRDLPIYITGDSTGILRDKDGMYRTQDFPSPRDKDGMYRAQNSSSPRYHPVGTGCDPVLRCLGHQACIFKPSLKLCGLDPQPDFRKQLEVRYVCTTDAAIDTLTYERHQRERAREVLYISITEMDHGYYGVCDDETPPPEKVVSDLWKVLGRVPSEACRDELLQVYCAYHYNRHGGCVPALVTSQVDKDGVMFYNDVVLPRKGRRPDERKHREVLAHPHVSLIPARMAFALLVHNNPDAVVQLLESIYREYFHYVIHVDKSQANVRQATEELLRMGSWDFVINLSGSDLALRDVDDMAAALAPHRDHGWELFMSKAIYGWELVGHGKNFIHVNHQWKDRHRSVWHSCGGHVYNVTRRGEAPAVADIYSASQWAVLSRDFAEFVVSNKSRDKNINGLQFYLQTSSIPDEKYLVSILMSSQFRHTLIPEHLHRIAPFLDKDRLGFCRHADETDMCGKGPRTFHQKDVPSLLRASRRFMFARKFDGRSEDPTRRAVSRWQRRDFYLNLQQHGGVSDALLRTLAQRACQRVHGDGTSKVCSSVPVLSWRVLPRLVPDKSTCCVRTNKHSSSRHWETNRHTVLPKLEEAGAAMVHLRLLAKATREETETGTCTLNRAHKGNNGTETMFARFDKLQGNKNTILHFSIRVMNPRGEEHCRKLTAFLWNPPKARHNIAPEKWFHDKLVCAPLGPGRWTLWLEQLYVAHPYQYETTLHMISNTTLNQTGDTFSDTWQVEDVMEITDHINSTNSKNQPLSQPVPVRKSSRMWLSVRLRTVHSTDQLLAAGSVAAIIMVLFVLMMTYQHRRKKRYKKLFNVARILLILLLITLVLRNISISTTTL